MLVKVPDGYPFAPSARIPLQDGRFALVDPDWLDCLLHFHWFAKKSFHCWYAVRKVTENSHTYFIRMHRVIAETPLHLVCHHINKNPLDNRRLNLLNLSEFEHAKYFSYR